MTNIHYYEFTGVEKQKLKDFIHSFALSDLLKKTAYKGKLQEVIYDFEGLRIRVYANRLYPNMKSYKTNIQGDVRVEISNGSELFTTTLPELEKLVDWEEDGYSYRMIVPNVILAETMVKPFIVSTIELNLPVYSNDYAQVTYYNELGGGQSLLDTHPQIIIENKIEE